MQFDMSQPNFFSILTATVRYDNRLTDFEKILYSEITALCNLNGHCWATNEYFAEKFNKKKESVSRNLKKLKTLKYIKTEIDKTAGNERLIFALTPINPTVNAKKLPINPRVNAIYNNNIYSISKDILEPNGSAASVLKTKKASQVSDEVKELVRLFYRKVHTNHPYLVKTSNRFADTIGLKRDYNTLNNLINKIDDIELIEKLLNWALDNDFWKQHIRRINKFVQKFDTVLTQSGYSVLSKEQKFKQKYGSQISTEIDEARKTCKLCNGTGKSGKYDCVCVQDIKLKYEKLFKENV